MADVECPDHEILKCFFFDLSEVNAVVIVKFLRVKCWKYRGASAVNAGLEM